MCLKNDTLLIIVRFKCTASTKLFDDFRSSLPTWVTTDILHFLGNVDNYLSLSNILLYFWLWT